MSVCCECCVLSGRGFCVELIALPEESYRLWCVVVCDLETSSMRRPWPALGRSATVKKNKLQDGRSQWLRGLRRRSAVARLLGLWVRIPPGAWMSACCECCVLSGRGLSVGLITRPEESYRVWCVWVWSWSLDNEEALTHSGCCAIVKKKTSWWPWWVETCTFIVNIKLVVATAVVMHSIFGVTTHSGMYNLGLVTQCTVCETTGFHRGVVDTVALLGCYITYIGSRLPTFRESLSVQSSSVKQAAWTLKMNLTNCPET